MIKKLLAVLGLFLIPLSFSFADFQEFDLGLTEEITVNSNLGYSLELQDNANFVLNDEYRVLQFAGVGQYSSTRTYFRNWDGNTGSMYVAVSCVGGYNCNGSILKQGYFIYVNILDLSYFDNSVNNTIPMGSTPVEEFFGNPIYNNPDKLLLGGYGVMQNGGVCFIYSDLQKAVCFSYDRVDNGNYLGDNIGLSSQDLDYLSNYATFSPFVSQGGNNVPIPSSTGLDSYTYIEVGSGDYIDYYEQQEHFSEDLCYIGTKDLDSNYEDRIPYYQGTGYTIFDAYSNLYNTNSLTVNKVGMFLNMIYANYRSWFLGYNRDSNGNVIYNMVYSGGSIELDYSTGLVNPFLNNKAYLYFIGSTALQTPNIDVYVAGQDVALYCYYKLNNYSNDGNNYTVNDDYDHKGLDQRVAVNSKNNRTQTTFYSGANEIVGKSWEGTPLEYFQQGSGFIDPSDFFNENFNKFKEVLTPLSPGDLGLGYLPGYIIMFMCALILFRFLGH